MAASTLNCPTCGASIASDSTSCQYCGTRLATISCPSCFGTAFRGSRFCPHCGHELAAETLPTATKLNCPRCKTALSDFELGHARLRDCEKCCGIWVQTSDFQRICADQEDQAEILGSPVPVPRDEMVNQRAYLPCPVCQTLMTRSQFSRHSGVIIDLCRAHGVWFDRDELRHIIEFIRSGGLDRARGIEKAELEEAREGLEESRRESARDEDLRSISATSGLLNILFG